MTLQEYIGNVSRRYKLGNATEHTFRGDLQQLLETIVPDISATNEPKRQACGAPDYVITKKEIPVGYIEAKDLGIDLKSKTLKEQFDRYRSSLENLMFTDYLDFHLYGDGEFITSIKVGEIKNGQIVPLPENFQSFTDLFKTFCITPGQTIKSSKKLAEMMAGKARMLSSVIEKALTSDEINLEDSTLKEQMNAFKEILIHDIKPKEFADIYAQTIAYGMFAARLHDPSLNSFSRQEAAVLIPKTNPFLRKLFQYIAGYDLDIRITWIVDALADIFRATDVAALLKNFGKATQMQDPIIHFYETFLAEYDPKLRKARGVWYTPEPVVNFIVRAVDDILKSEFDLPQGLADTTKTKIKVDTQTFDKRTGKYKQVEQEVHKVQILDPATGTGTFLAEVIQHIYKKFEGQQGIWSNYVENHLIPRLNGFELLMASYAMAHLKLDMLLTETGYKSSNDQRFRVYLTNSLEEHHQDTGTLFANWLSSEANEANHIKRDTPVMCVIGNPPYSVSSTNKSEWIEKLTADYKKDLNERNIQPLSDDYIKFIRYGQHFIDKNGEGILAIISNNSFLDGIIHRQMRKFLSESFDKIYILDLHGNAKKRETAPDGSVDQNVFDIMQGVSINLLIKTGKKKNGELSEIYAHDTWGKRENKYNLLANSSYVDIAWKKVILKSPGFYFVAKDYSVEAKYKAGFSINKIFRINASGIKTHRDHFVIDSSLDTLISRVNTFFDVNRSTDEIRHQLNLKDNRDWSLIEARKGLFDKSLIRGVLYRPFDIQHIYYDLKLIDFARYNVMQHMISGDNLALISVVQAQAANIQHFDCIFISNRISDTNMFRRGGPNIFPLYLNANSSGQQTIGQTTERIPNLNPEIVNQIADNLDLTFTNEKELQAPVSANENASPVCYAQSDEVREEFDAGTTPKTFAPIDILDYIYAVLHSPSFREKFKEFLKIDFPRVPYPKDAITFWKLAKLGGEIRTIHLLESPKVEQYITNYPQDGNNTITRSIGKKDWELYDPEERLGRIWINDEQFFDKVPLIAWEFYIGGYQPAQKWLKDRKSRELTFNDILHYQKIIVALSETDRIMKEIDKTEFE